MNDRSERLFLAAPPDAEARHALAEQLASLPLPGRPVPPENWHLTLRFLGDCPRAAAERVVEALARVPLPPPFTCRLQGWGAFPRPGRARVLWIGLQDPDGRLPELASHAESAARAAGFPAERRGFRPHITVRRFPGAADLRRGLAALPPIGLHTRFERVVLYRSLLGSGPACYEPLHVFPLEAG